MDETNTPTGAERYLASRLEDPTYREAYEEAKEPTRVLSVRLPIALADEIERRADEVDRSTSWYIKNAMTVMLERLQTPENVASPEAPLAEQWAIADEAGMGGHTYEVGVTFLLPPVNEPDFVAYDIRDIMSRTAYHHGARDVVTRLVSLTSMRMDERLCSPQTNVYIDQSYGTVSTTNE